MKKLIFIILFLFINVVQADNHDTATTEEEIREARTLVTATEKVSISSEIAARVEKICDRNQWRHLMSVRREYM